MASSRKSSRDKSPPRPRLKKGASEAGELAERVALRLAACVKPGDHLVVGLSGGVDSVVLLDCLQRCASRLRIRLSALHVNHQLNPNARRWVSFCRRWCRARGIPCASVKVKVDRSGGVEAAARAARYAAYARRECDAIALAHHRDDQVETFLLQLLRGAGVKGLAAMPLLKSKVESRKSKGKSPSLLRPMLDVTRAEILAYSKARKLKWVEDDSNADVRFARNYLRHAVLPVLARRFPACLSTIARSIGHVAEAARLLDEVAASDADGYLKDGALAVEALRRLPAARARNLLRAFLAGHGVAMPGVERLEEGLRQALEAKRDARVLIELDGASLRRHAGYLHVVRAGKAPAGYARRWRGEKRLALDGIGVLTLARASGAGISLARLREGSVTIRSRRGGERLRPDHRRPRRSLKNLLQESNVPPWMRERLPLLFCGGKLVWVAGIGVDCEFQARAGEPALVPGWLPGRAEAVSRASWKP
jgi:tRNA(Ile)-lysidine synthase